jgi:hypothetical protein
MRVNPAMWFMWFTKLQMNVKWIVGNKEMSSIFVDQLRPRIWGQMRGEGGSCGVSTNEEYSCAHGAQLKFGDQTPYLTYGTDVSAHKIGWESESDVTAAPIGVWIRCNGCSYWLSSRVTV